MDSETDNSSTTGGNSLFEEAMLDEDADDDDYTEEDEEDEDEDEDHDQDDQDEEVVDEEEMVIEAQEGKIGGPQFSAEYTVAQRLIIYPLTILKGQNIDV